MKLIHYSGGKLLNGLIKNSELIIVEKCNHIIHVDQPKLAANLILKHLKKLS